VLRGGRDGRTDADIALVYVGLGDQDQAIGWLNKGYEARFKASILMRRRSIRCGPTLDSRSLCAVLAFRDEGKGSAAMDAYSRIELEPRDQHVVCVTEDHIGRPIVFRRIREAATRMASHCARF
jgi:hypothetical protein